MKFLEIVLCNHILRLIGEFSERDLHIDFLHSMIKHNTGSLVHATI